MNCKEINQINTEELLRYFHIESVRRTGMELLYHAPYRKDNRASMSVNIGEKMVWFDHAAGQGGSNIDLLMLIYNLTSVSEVLKRFNAENFTVSPSSNNREKKEAPTNELQWVKDLQNSSLIQYVKRRGIDLELAKAYLKEVHYSNKYGRFYALGFPNSNGREYELRNGIMKHPICIGKKSISIIKNDSNMVLIFEGFFDFLSHLQLQKSALSESVIVLNSVSQLSKAISYLNEYSEPQINLYLDNDSAGKEAANTLINLFKGRVKDRSIEYSKHKDLNEFLQYKINRGNNLEM
jgi:hypothetical protein